ncbi:MAG: hypothetical protein ACI4D7_07290 [Lachnospiraceae bacterium]
MEKEVIDFLRDRAEENLDDVLKSSMGGYTKKSVQDYVSQLRRQQQTAGRRFNEDMKNVLAEKEALKEELTRMKARLSSKEAQYLALSESLQEYRQAEEENSVENLVDLKRQLAKQEDTISTLSAEKQLLIQKQSQAEQNVKELKKELEQKAQEHSLTKELFHEEKKKNKQTIQQMQEVSSRLTIAQDEIAFLKGQLTEGEVAKLKANVGKLQNELKVQQELLEQRKKELNMREQQIQSDAKQLDMKDNQVKRLREKNEKLQQIVDQMTEENQQLEAYQQELTEKLQEEFQKNLDMLHAKSKLQLENLKMSQKLGCKSLELPAEEV